jgi:hypothetical protein
MSTPSLELLSPAQRERLAYIEFRIWFFGRVTRKDVLTRFGLASAAGTRDLALYQKLAPANLAYAGKAYHYLPGFTPMFAHASERVLSALTSGFGDGDRRDTSASLSCEVPQRLNQPRPDIIATITRAIAGQYAVSLRYHSMKTGAVEREIVPHSLVDSGLRWHVRAYDRTKGGFRDLVLTRMDRIRAEPQLAAPAPQEAQAADEQWQRQVDLILAPHPRHAYPESIARDYGMTDGALHVRLRAAVVGYVLRQWQVDCSAGATGSDPHFRLRLANPSCLDGIANNLLAPGYVPAA